MLAGARSRAPSRGTGTERTGRRRAESRERRAGQDGAPELQRCSDAGLAVGPALVGCRGSKACRPQAADTGRSSLVGEWGCVDVSTERQGVITGSRWRVVGRALSLLSLVSLGPGFNVNCRNIQVYTSGLVCSLPPNLVNDYCHILFEFTILRAFES